MSPPPPVALFCHEPADRPVGAHAVRVAAGLARRGREVHLITPHPYPGEAPLLRCHAVPGAARGGASEQVEAFTVAAIDCFRGLFAGRPAVAVVGHDWPCGLVLSRLRGASRTLSLRTLARPAAGGASGEGRRAIEIERQGVEAADRLLVHDEDTAAALALRVPGCLDRVVRASRPFPSHRFARRPDPVAVKASCSLGPSDRLLLFIGDLEEGPGPDLLLRALPAILRRHPRCRLVMVGRGGLDEPLHAFARYLQVQHAVRLVGRPADGAVGELIGAADVVVVPSRKATPWWPILAAWAAGTPVVVTHQAAEALTEYDRDAVRVYPSENSIVEGVDRLLRDAAFGERLAAGGRRKLDDRFGPDAPAGQLDALTAAPAG